jgi:hypothetical protein
VLRDDSGPLGQFLRDPDIPLQEKLDYVKELRTISTWGAWGQEVTIKGNKYSGLFIQVLTSRKISQEEKLDLLFWIENLIREEYTSATQKQQMGDDIAQL